MRDQLELNNDIATKSLITANKMKSELAIHIGDIIEEIWGIQGHLIAG